MGTSKFDIADYLENKEMIAEYLNTVLEEGNESDIIVAIGYVAKAIGGPSRNKLFSIIS